MNDGRAWEGNWRARLDERVRERGYDSLTAFVSCQVRMAPSAGASRLIRT
jgi:hypothetical protein